MKVKLLWICYGFTSRGKTFRGLEVKDKIKVKGLKLNKDVVQLRVAYFFVDIYFFVAFSDNHFLVNWEIL